MRKLHKLNIYDITHLCYHLHCQSNELSQVIKNKRRYYRSFVLKKGNKERTIEPPTGRLKFLQANLKNFLNRLFLPEELHGGITGRSPVTNAQRHVYKNAVLNFDLSSFYPSVTADMVYHLFLKRLGCSKRIAELLMELTTYRNQLPQGAPTSTVIANLVIAPLANRLSGLAAHHNCDYTQFIDDGTFSGPAYIDKIRHTIEKILQDCGFKINSEKTKFFLRHCEEQIVTGVKVNKGIDIPKNKPLEVELLLQELKKGEGMYKINSIKGKIAHIHQLNPKIGKKYLDSLSSINSK